MDSDIITNKNKYHLLSAFVLGDKKQFGFALGFWLGCWWVVFVFKVYFFNHQTDCTVSHSYRVIQHYLEDAFSGRINSCHSRDLKTLKIPAGEKGCTCLILSGPG